ncbi:MAG: hypothetical protein AAF571_02655 [Verrucomicrobiota bacterium]
MTVKRWIWRGLLGLAALIVLLVSGLYIAYLVAYGDLKNWAESESFRAMLSHQVSRALKVHGEFGEITLVEDLTAEVTSFESVGRAGEAIGSMNAYEVRGTFNPWAIFWSVWEIERVDIARGEFKLRLPDDTLKEPLSQGKKPWYNFLMPRRFYCGEIVCPDADVVFPFQGTEGRLSDLHLTATMVGQDFKYDCRDGLLEFPYFPKMHVDELKMFITRDKADIEKARLRGVDGDPATAEIEARIGMREDKSIRAKVKTGQMPVAKILPPELQGKLSGRINGDVFWNTDETGKKIHAGGQIQLKESIMQRWSWLDELARVHGNEELRSFEFDEVFCDFEIKDSRFEAKQIRVEAPDSFSLEGLAAYDWVRKVGMMKVDVKEMPLSKWLPAEVKARVEGHANAKLEWEGSVEDAAHMKARGEIDLVGAVFNNPVRFEALLAPYGIEVPDVLDLQNAEFDFTYNQGAFEIQQASFETADIGRLNFQASWDGEDRLTMNGVVDQIDLHRWMHEEAGSDIHGILSVTGSWSCPQWNFEKGSGAGTLNLTGACFRGWGIQRTLVRFLEDESWLTIDVEPVTIHWQAKDGQFEFPAIEIFSPGKIGVRGALKQGSNNELSGEIWLGMHQKNLTWLPGATDRVFIKKEDGLHWMKVTMSGTIAAPEHDLDDQISKQLLRHPFALIGLGFRGVSWWAGDVLGTYKSPEALPLCKPRPEP